MFPEAYGRTPPPLFSDETPYHSDSEPPPNPPPVKIIIHGCIIARDTKTPTTSTKYTLYTTARRKGKNQSPSMQDKNQIVPILQYIGLVNLSLLLRLLKYQVRLPLRNIQDRLREYRVCPRKPTPCFYVSIFSKTNQEEGRQNDLRV